MSVEPIIPSFPPLLEDTTVSFEFYIWLGVRINLSKDKLLFVLWLLRGIDVLLWIATPPHTSEDYGKTGRPPPAR